jgi:hypothetical protein
MPYQEIESRRFTLAGIPYEGAFKQGNKHETNQGSFVNLRGQSLAGSICFTLSRCTPLSWPSFSTIGLDKDQFASREPSIVLKISELEELAMQSAEAAAHAMEKRCQ